MPMDQLYKFCWNRRAVWSNGARFDIVVAENAFRQVRQCNTLGPSILLEIQEQSLIFVMSQLTDGKVTNITQSSRRCSASRQVAVVQSGISETYD